MFVQGEHIRTCTVKEPLEIVKLWPRLRRSKGGLSVIKLLGTQSKATGVFERKNNALMGYFIISCTSENFDCHWKK